jgi:hypothetical protein
MKGKVMSAEELMERLFERLSKPMMPVSMDLWDTSHIAAYLKRSEDYIRKEVVSLPSFPRPVRLPVHGRAQALYKAREVTKWAESYTS